jgi:hypothetical protein
MLAITALVAAMLVAVTFTGSAQAGPVFVTRNGAAFDLGGQPFRFTGTNTAPSTFTRGGATGTSG